MKRGLRLEKVVLLGRTFGEYLQFFALTEPELTGKSILDVASGVSSFTAEARERGLEVSAADPIYALAPEEISGRAEPDLDLISNSIGKVPAYTWRCYRSVDEMRGFRERAVTRFLKDYPTGREKHYFPSLLPNLPFADRQFDLTLVSYFLFVYQEQFSYEFHRDSVLELMRVTRGEARIYPTVTFEAEKSEYIPRLREDVAMRHLEFSEVATDFEFLAGSNSYLRVRHR